MEAPMLTAAPKSPRPPEAYLVVGTLSAGFVVSLVIGLWLFSQPRPSGMGTALSLDFVFPLAGMFCLAVFIFLVSAVAFWFGRRWGLTLILGAELIIGSADFGKAMASGSPGTGALGIIIQAVLCIALLFRQGKRAVRANDLRTDASDLS